MLRPKKTSPINQDFEDFERDELPIINRYPQEASEQYSEFPISLESRHKQLSLLLQSAIMHSLYVARAYIDNSSYISDLKSGWIIDRYDDNNIYIKYIYAQDLLNMCGNLENIFYIRLIIDNSIVYIPSSYIKRLMNDLLPGERGPVFRSNVQVTYENKVTRDTASGGMDDQPFENTNPVRDTFTATADPKELGETLTTLRESQSISRRATAKLMDRSEASLRQLESGHHSQTISKIQEYADALGYEVKVHFVPSDKG